MEPTGPGKMNKQGKDDDTPPGRGRNTAGVVEPRPSTSTGVRCPWGSIGSGAGGGVDGQGPGRAGGTSTAATRFLAAMNKREKPKNRSVPGVGVVRVMNGGGGRSSVPTRTADDNSSGLGLGLNVDSHILFPPLRRLRRPDPATPPPVSVVRPIVKNEPEDVPPRAMEEEVITTLGPETAEPDEEEPDPPFPTGNDLQQVEARDDDAEATVVLAFTAAEPESPVSPLQNSTGPAGGGHDDDLQNNPDSAGGGPDDDLQNSPDPAGGGPDDDLQNSPDPADVVYDELAAPPQVPDLGINSESTECELASVKRRNSSLVGILRSFQQQLNDVLAPEADGNNVNAPTVEGGGDPQVDPADGQRGEAQNGGSSGDTPLAIATFAKVTEIEAMMKEAWANAQTERATIHLETIENLYEIKDAVRTPAPPNEPSNTAAGPGPTTLMNSAVTVMGPDPVSPSSVAAVTVSTADCENRMTYAEAVKLALALEAPVETPAREDAVDAVYNLSSNLDFPALLDQNENDGVDVEEEENDYVDVEEENDYVDVDGENEEDDYIDVVGQENNGADRDEIDGVDVDGEDNVSFAGSDNDYEMLTQRFHGIGSGNRRGEDEQAPVVTRHERDKQVSRGDQHFCTCGLQFASSATLWIHCVLSGPPKLKCNQVGCEVAVHFPNSFNKHLKDIHGIIEPKNRFICYNCYERFDDKKLKARHKCSANAEGVKADGPSPAKKKKGDREQ